MFTGSEFCRSRSATFLPAVAVLMVAFASLGPRAQAQTRPMGAGLSVSWQGPPECPSESDFAGRVRAHLTADQLRSDQGAPGQPTPVVAIARVGRAGAAFELELRVESDAGTARRQLVDGDCAALAESAALLIAIAMDSAQRDRGGAASDSEAVGSSRAGDAGSGVSWLAGAGLSLDQGIQAGGPSPMLALAAQARLAPVRLGLDLGLLLPRRSLIGVYDGARLELSAIIASGRGCLDLSLGSGGLFAAACLVGGLGRLSARVSGIDAPRSRARLWLSGGGGLSLGYRLDPFVGTLGGELLVPADRLRFAIEGPGGVVEVHRIDATVARLGARILYAF